MNTHTRSMMFALSALLAIAMTLGLGDRANALVPDGAWRMDLPKDSGVVFHTIITIHPEGDKIRAAVTVNAPCAPSISSDAREEGGGVIFSLPDWDWKFSVTPQGPNLRVALSIDGGKTQESHIAVPAAKSDFSLPAVIPPPPFRDLPPNGLALTPPMGWNSWNHFGETVDDKIIRETADAIVASGMAAAGYVYVNIDDTWELGRDAAGNILANRKFPDMKALADYVHSKGLKLGIYSSPGFQTCGCYEGSYGHEAQDAKTYATWGIDYLKYDWCSASQLYPDSALRAIYQRMADALRASGRPIVFSFCEYGMGDVWTWGPKAGANLWRTTGDIEDNWESMCRNGFSQDKLAPYAAPGHWNDPDMLEVGNGRMTPLEYRTHFSLWCMLAAPLIAGNDLRTMSNETREILTNREVIAVDQDSLGRQGTAVSRKDGIEIWTKSMSGGAKAIAIFNRNTDERPVTFVWSDLGFTRQPASVRDLWRHVDCDVSSGYSIRVPGHGVFVLLVK